MNVVFRTDAALDIGTGHVMRSLTLADALKEQGAYCRFVCRAHPGNLIELIRGRGFDAVALPLDDAGTPDGGAAGPLVPPHAQWLGATWPADATQTQAAIDGLAVDWLVVDHYGLDARWEKQLRTGRRRLMVIDDLADRAHTCDLLLDQNLGRTEEDYRSHLPDRCAMLVGPQYALLRPRFAELRAHSLARRASAPLKHLMISMGGVDKDNATGRVLKALVESGLSTDCRITVVLGPHAPWLAQVKEIAAGMPWKTQVLSNVSDMAKIMAESDLAIGAAGSTSWERCVLGLPTLMLILAENQQEAGASLAAEGAVRLIENGSTLEGAVNEEIRQLGGNMENLRAMSAAAAATCEGRGVHLVAGQLFKSIVSL